LLFAAVLAAACSSALPEENDPGAVVLRTRCGGCHRVFAPGTMTIETWKFQMGRMHAEFARRGIPWLTPDEEAALLAYLGRHAGG
jgi:hypothetical protein